MKRYMIPMIIVVDAANERHALEMANTIRHEGDGAFGNDAALLFDEELKIKVGDIKPDHELPHTYNDSNFV